jgi:HD-GYP domain-containing protein (c-di-GMP phosphodiesterase class II)
MTDYFAHPEIKEMMQELGKRVPYCPAHQSRVTGYALLAAKINGVGEEVVEDIRKWGQLHDVGKILLPEGLVKKGNVSPEELGVIQEHAVLGVVLLEKAGTLDGTPPAPVLSHHERHDGGGYPAGLSGFQIPESARYIVPADKLDALTSKRPYREYVLEPDAAIEAMSQWPGPLFHPYVFGAFHMMLRSETAEVKEIMQIRDWPRF